MQNDFNSFEVGNSLPIRQNFDIRDTNYMTNGGIPDSNDIQSSAPKSYSKKAPMPYEKLKKILLSAYAVFAVLVIAATTIRIVFVCKSTPHTTQGNNAELVYATTLHDNNSNDDDYAPEAEPLSDNCSTGESVHNYGEWKTTRKPTCSLEGTKEQICIDCGYKNIADIPKSEHIWEEATCTTPKKCKICGATEGSSAAHAYPNSDLKCPTCNKSVDAADYEYLAGSDFRTIRREYNYAVASSATMILYKDLMGDAIILIKIYYNIGGMNFEETVLHNLTKKDVIKDPEAYYNKLANRAYGENKIFYLNLLKDVKVMELHMLKNESTHTVSGEYLNL